MPYATESKFGRKMFYFQNRVLYESSIIRSGYLDPLNSKFSWYGNRIYWSNVMKGTKA